MLLWGWCERSCMMSYGHNVLGEEEFICIECDSG